MLEYVAVASPVHPPRPNDEGRITSGTSLLLFDQADIHTQRIGELLGPMISIKQRHYLPDWYALLSAAVAGVGYAVMPRRLVQDFIVSGKLITVIESAELFIPLYLHYWRLKSTRLDKLIGIARKVAAQKMLPPASQRNGVI
ncbi:hypothetical protein LGH82_03130 [Mesorhizobium sp. PAMC28654]|uniref:LysR substrate-binding domain-containing protein n=1 Tax=Mesorhizobium sp. PAMC28654 TaxID=2880934 RepID=UPI001D0B6850|nr:hypothetical protein LGH82_03130 [Mesorhizobium sp. PAMC28654]